MLHALIRRKLGRAFDRDPLGIEDLLTSVVFGACDYAPDPQDALAPFLGAARKLDGAALAPLVADVVAAELEFWPWWAGRSGAWANGEPDLVVRTTDADGRRSMLVVEAKLWGGKNAAPSREGPVTDQLGKYWLGLEARSAQEGRRPLGVVYLVPGITPPAADIAEAQRELAAKGHGGGSFWWLSWRRFAQHANAGSSRIVRDAVRLMRDKWQLVEVEMGRWPRPIEVPAPWRFEVTVRWPHPRKAAPWRFAVQWPWPPPPARPPWQMR